ncbi:MAG: GNAT family N-acetyltransferase [Actinomycetota bacterium]|nr:GNAT family N-acetyltransferase [Actinomycetota bacterium]
MTKNAVEAEPAAPPGYEVRRPTMDDIGAAATLIRDVELHDWGFTEETEDDLAVSWRLADLEQNVWLVFDEQENAVGYGFLRSRAPGKLRSFVTVSPAHRGRGIGTNLVGLVEARARAMTEDVPVGTPVVVSQEAGLADPSGRLFLEAHGYGHARRFWKMETELDRDPPAPQWPDGIRLETLTPDLERAVYDAMEEAFQDHWDHVPHPYDEWRAWSIEREHHDPSLWLLAFAGDEIAGASLCDIREDGGWINVLGVRRPWRRSGLGLGLLQASFGALRGKGQTRAALYVDAESPTGATRLYERAGMRVTQESDAYEKVLREAAVIETVA